MRLTSGHPAATWLLPISCASERWKWGLRARGPERAPPAFRPIKIQERTK